MCPFSYDAIVEQLIANQRAAIRYRIAFAGGVAALGVIVIVLSLLFSSQLVAEGLKTILGIGGGFVSSLSAFQIGAIIRRREKLGVFRAIRDTMHSLDTDTTVDNEKRRALEETIQEALRKTALE